MSYEQAIALANGSSLPTWAYENSVYWTGITGENNTMVYVNFDGNMSSYSYNNDSFYGIRPVITINKSEL